MSNPDQIRAEIEQTRLHLGTDVDALADKVSPSSIAQREKDKVRSRITSARESVMGSVHQAQDAVQGAADSGGSAASDARSTAAGHPLVVGLIAFGAGWLLSSLLPSTSTEQELAVSAKEKVAPLTEKVKDVAEGAGKEIGQNLKEPAQQAAAAVKDSATDSARTVQQEGRSAAQDVKGQAQESKDAVQGQAQDAKDRLQGQARDAREQLPS